MVMVMYLYNAFSMWIYSNALYNTLWGTLPDCWHLDNLQIGYFVCKHSLHLPVVHATQDSRGLHCCPNGCLSSTNEILQISV